MRWGYSMTGSEPRFPHRTSESSKRSQPSSTHFFTPRQPFLYESVIDRRSTTPRSGCDAAGKIGDSGQLWSHDRWPLLILVAYIPMLLVHFSWLWFEPQYQFFPLLIAVVAYLVWSRLEPRPDHAPGPQRRIFAYTLLAVAWIILAVATVVVYSPWLAAFSFILSFGAVLMLSSERFYLQNRFGIWLLLCLYCRFRFGMTIDSRVRFRNSRPSSAPTFWNESTFPILPMGRS